MEELSVAPQKNCRYCDLFQAQALFDDCEFCAQAGYGCGIVSREKASGMVLTIADWVGRPIALLQQLPLDARRCKSAEKTGKRSPLAQEFQRVEGRLYYSLRGRCQALRDTCLKDDHGEDRPCDDDAFAFGLCNCYQLDALMAKTLLERAQSSEQAGEGIETLPRLFGQEEEAIPYECAVTEPAASTAGGRLYVLYKCPHSLFFEVAFLVKVGAVRGVMLAGQVMFSDPAYEADRAELNHSLEQANYPEAECMDRAEFIHKADAAIEMFETQMRQLLTERNEIRANKAVTNAATKFRQLWETIPQIDPAAQNPMEYNKNYSKLIGHLKDVICNTNDPGRPGVREMLGIEIKMDSVSVWPARLMGDGPLRQNKQETYDQATVAWQLDGVWVDAGEVERDEEKWSVHNITGLRFEPEHFSGTQFRVEISGVTIPEEYEGIKGSVFEVRQYIKSAFERIFRQFCLMAQGMEASANAALLYTLMSAIRHEMVQVYQGQICELDKYQWRIHEKNGLPRDESMDLFRDAKGYAHTSVLRATNSRYMSLIPKPDKTRFFPYKEFLHKWRFIVTSEIRNLPISLYLDKVERTDESRPKMYGDKAMVEQITYNLINNAIKYAMHGTVIRVNCQLGKPVYRESGEAIQVYELRVSNYADHQPDMDVEKLFDFARRSSSVRSIVGSGIGLWFARQMAQAQGGTLTAEITPVSDFRILPLKLLMEHYRHWPTWLSSYREEMTAERDKLLAQATKMTSYEVEMRAAKEEDMTSPNIWEEVDTQGYIAWKKKEDDERRKKTGIDYYGLYRVLKKGTDLFTFTLRLPQTALAEGETLNDFRRERDAR